MITDPFGIVVVLLAAVAVSEWAGGLGWLRKLGAAVLVIAIGAALANLRLIPAAGAGGAPYDQIFDYVIPAGIFLLLLDVNLRSLRRVGAPIVIAFLLGAIGVMVGVLVASLALPTAPLGRFGGPVAGMFTGTYIGGSANFNAVATAYGVERQGGVYLAAVVVDNVMTVLWMLVLLAMPRLLRATGLFAERDVPAPDVDCEPARAEVAAVGPVGGIAAIAIPLALAGAGLWISFALADVLAAAGFPVPAILIVTTLALLLAQIGAVSRLTLAAPIGMWAIYLFLAVVGATADIDALVKAQALGWHLFAYVAIVFAVHGAVMLAGALALKLDPETLAVASVANIGGSATAPAVAEAVGRDDLALPGIVVGALGTALGTYAGFAMARIVGG